MAYQRLAFERSPALVWFGALLGVGTFALDQAKAGVQLLYVVLYVLAALAIAQGIHGEWWKVPRIDLDARLLRLGTGEVVALDTLGDVRIDGRKLLATGVDTPIYTSPFPRAVIIRKYALDAALRRGGPRRLHRLRRLAFHRSWGLFVFTLIGFALLTGATIGNIVMSDVHEIEFKLLAIAGYAVCFAWFRRALFGSNTREQMFVDPIAGVLMLEDARLIPLDALGPLRIAESRIRSGRTTLINYELRAENLDGVLFAESYYTRPTKRRFDALSTAVLQYELRRVLDAPQVDGDAFRSSGADPIAEAKRLAHDSPYRAAAFAALSRDPDPTIRDRARSLV